MSAFRYRVAGLSVASDIELPGAIADPSQAPADVVIRAARVPEALEAPTAEGPTWQANGESVRLDIPGIGRFLICCGEIRYRADGGADAADLAPFLAGPLLALSLSLKGRPVLRASGVLVEGKAVLFCGPSGAGKSTLAAALAARGHRLLVDDVCALTLSPMTLASPPQAHPDTGSLTLWRQAIRALRLGRLQGPRLRPSLEKHHVAIGSTSAGPAPIRAVYNLRESRPPFASGIEAPNIVDAALVLRRNAYHPSMVEPLGRQGLYFQAGAAIAAAARVFHLTRPLTFAALPETVDRLQQHWAELGLMEAAA